MIFGHLQRWTNSMYNDRRGPILFGTKESRSKGWLQRWEASLIYLQKMVPLWAVLVVFFKTISSLLFWPFVKYMHHPFTSISPACFCLFFLLKNIWRFWVMKLCDFRTCLQLILPKKKKHKKPTNPQIFLADQKEQFYKQKWESIRSAQAWDGMFWFGMMGSPADTRIFYGNHEIPHGGPKTTLSRVK